jgi:hypothetical protein
MGEEIGVQRVLVGKPEGKRPLGRPRRRWEDNINLLAPKFGILILAHPVCKVNNTGTKKGSLMK